MPRGLLIASGARESDSAGLEDRSVRWQGGGALAGRDRDRGRSVHGVAHVGGLSGRGGGLEVSNDALERGERIARSFGGCARVRRRARALLAAALPGHAVPVVTVTLGRPAVAAAGIAIALRLGALKATMHGRRVDTDMCLLRANVCTVWVTAVPV